MWNAAVETAQYRIHSHATVPPVPFPTTVEEKCWVTLMALRREEELQEMAQYLENVWRELREVRCCWGLEIRILHSPHSDLNLLLLSAASKIVSLQTTCILSLIKHASLATDIKIKN